MSIATAASLHTVDVPEVGLPPRGLIRRFTAHPRVMPYYRLAVAVIALNLLTFAKLPSLAPTVLSNLAIINFTVALLMRQQRVINLLFKVATSIPTHWPLSIRWAAAKVYHFGGVHVGAFASGTVWLAAFAVSVGHALVFAHVAVLLLIIVLALPQIRHQHHDAFERVARFGGWASLAMFWAQAALFGAGAWQLAALAVVTLSVASPWFSLRRVPVDIATPSNHVALAHFDYGVTPFAGSSTELSRSPLLEWHAFANVPSPDSPGYRLTISRAGDWTGQLVDDAPSHVWVKGIPTAGVGNIEALFKKVVWVATGSGIGPCLPHLLKGDVPARLVWSTRTPRKTYGDALVDEILDAQPDAVIWDTTVHGKPDLVQLAHQAFKEFDAEAVICISNRKLTFHLNYELESRGIPAFGAIWDS